MYFEYWLSNITFSLAASDCVFSLTQEFGEDTIVFCGSGKLHGEGLIFVWYIGIHVVVLLCHPNLVSMASVPVLMGLER